MNNIAQYKGKKVLIIEGGSRQALPIIKGFHQLGFETTAYCSSKLDVAAVFKYTDKVVYSFYDDKNKEKTFKSILSAVRNVYYDIIVPTFDFPAMILSENKKELEKYCGYVYVNDSEIFKMAIDKLNTMRVCMDNGIPCPKTAIVSKIEELDLSDWRFPLVVKPRVSFGAKGFFIVKDEKDFKNIYNGVNDKFSGALVQEYIPKGSSQYQVEMVVDKLGKLKSFLLMDKLRWYPFEGGSSTLNVTVHDEEIKTYCLKLLNTISWCGYASLDLVRDPRDNTPKILEINPRLNGTAKLCFVCGINIAKQIAEEAFGEEITEYLSYEDNIYLRHFHKDLLWFLKSKTRFSAKPSWFNFKNNTDELFYIEDLRPFFVSFITSFKKLLHDSEEREI